MRSIFVTVSTIFIMFNAPAQKIDSSGTSTFDLPYLIRQPKTAYQYPPVLFLFHGAGSNEQDLFSFADKIPDEWMVVSVRAPYAVAEGHYRWYDVKLVEEKITINFTQEEESRKKLIKFIDEVIAFYHADNSRVVLAGFSQGANMAAVVSLTAPEKVAGFAVFSGRFIEEIKPFISTSASLKAVKCFLSHGNQDLMLPIAFARENQQALRRLGIQVTFSEDTVAHSISTKLLEEFLLWLNNI